MATEKEIQAYIWANRQNWSSLIDTPNSPSYLDDEMPEADEIPEGVTQEEYEAIQLMATSPKDIIRSLVRRKLQDEFYAVKELELFGVEVPLTKEGTSAIRADFLGIQPDAPGIAVVELKKSYQTEREAFTELLAYAGHLNSIFSSHCTDDILLVLIAPMEGRTIREAFLQSLLFDKRRIFVLRPVLSDLNDVSTLRLVPYLPDEEAFSQLEEATLYKGNFDVQVITWEDLPGEWNPEEGDPGPELIARMNSVSSYAAQLMESKGIHGFVYATQTWPELKQLGHLTNALVIVGLNPYRCASTAHFIENQEGWKYRDIKRGANLIESLSDLLPGLNNSAEKLHQERNYLEHLEISWTSTLYRIGREVVKTLTMNTQGTWIEKGGGHLYYNFFEESFFESVARFNYDVRPVGLIRELLWEYTKSDYAFWAKHKTHPVHGDIEMWAADSLVSYMFFTAFLDRIFDPMGREDIEDEFFPEEESTDDNRLLKDSFGPTRTSDEDPTAKLPPFSSGVDNDLPF